MNFGIDVKKMLLGIMYVFMVSTVGLNAATETKGFKPTASRDFKTREICAKSVDTHELKADCANIKELCDCKAKIDKLWAEYLSTDALRADKAVIEKEFAKSIKACHLCADKAKIEKILAELIHADCLHACKADLAKISACDISTNDLCALNAKIIGNFENGTRYKALAANLTNHTGFVVGDPISFDTILFDPNNNLTSGPTTYTAPKSGFYIITLALQFQDLNGPNPLSGTPIARPELSINGATPADSMKSYYPFLSFSTRQNLNFTTLAHLQQGDTVQPRLSVKYVDPITGETMFVGTLTIDGDPKGIMSFFSVHYLSTDYPVGLPVHDANCEKFCIEKPCIPCCEPCEVPCIPCDICCDCHNEHHNDCDDHHGQCDDHCCDYNNHHDQCDDHHDDCNDHCGGNGHNNHEWEWNWNGNWSH